MRRVEYRLFGAGLLVGLSLACARVETDVPITGRDIFHASLEQPAETGTKVYADEDLMLLWHADDRVSIFDKYTFNQEYRFTGETGDNAGSFEKVPNGGFIVGNEIPGVYAVYPYQSSTSLSNQGVLTVVLPSEQTYAVRSFGRGSNTMVSSTDDNDLLFKNLGGFLVLKLYGEGSVSSITLKGNGGELLSGKVGVTAPVGGNPTLAFLPGEGFQEVTLTCPEPVALSASADDYTEFWFVLPPVVFQDGFSVNVTGPAGDNVLQSTAKTIFIERNQISRMAPFQVILSGDTVPPNNEIWYTTMRGEAVDPYVMEGFGAAIIGNSYEGGKGVLLFDGDVTALPNRAFYVKWLSSISLPNTVQSIGSSAFYRNSFEAITIPESVTSLSNSNPFIQCQNLKAFYGKYATEDHLALVDGDQLISFAIGIGSEIDSYSVPEGIKSISRYAFDGCIDLEEIILPASLEQILSGAFRSCRSMDHILLPEGLKKIGDDAFQDCRSLVEITIPDSIEQLLGNPFHSDGALRAFHGKYATADERSLVVGDELVSFAPAGLVSYSIPSGIKVIRQYAFYGTGLKRVILPETLEHIDYWAFAYNGDLESVTIPEGAGRIGEYAFYKCDHLNFVRVEATTPPTGGPSMFDLTNDCPIYVPAQSVEVYKSAPYWSDYADRIFPMENQPRNEIWYTSTDGQIVEPDLHLEKPKLTLLSNTYENGKGVLTFEEDLETIPFGIFASCKTLESVVFPEGVTTVNNAVFEYCENLLSVRFPSTVIQLGGYLFHDCYHLMSVNIPSGVTRIEEMTFAQCYDLPSISLPAGLTSIGPNAFWNCWTMESIRIPESVTTIESAAFGECVKLKSIVIPPHVKTVPPLLFANCDSLTDVTLPEGITSIGMHAFWYCRALRSVTIPSTVELLDEGAFYGCGALESMVVSGCVSEIGAECFYGCASLSSLVLGESLRIIGQTAFAECGSLRTVIIPEWVQEIGSGAFIYCDGLDEVYMGPLTPPVLGEDVFVSEYNYPIFVRQEVYSDYLVAEGWEAYRNRIVSR